jgi:hypothetical protein
MLDESNDRNLYEALYALRRRGVEGESFVIIEHLPMDKFVQFGIGPILRMDVPFISLSEEESNRAYVFFQELGGVELQEYDAPNPRTGRIRHGATFKFDFGDDVHKAVRATILFFARVHQLEINATLSVSEA